MQPDGKAHPSLGVVGEAVRGEVERADFQPGGPRVLRQAEDLQPPESPHRVGGERQQLGGALTTRESTCGYHPGETREADQLI